MRRIKTTAAVVPTLAALLCPSIQAADPGLRVSGFGTLGYVRVNNDDVQFVEPGQPTGAGTSGSFEPDSRLAVQLDAQFGNGLGATAQVLSKYSGKGSQTPAVEWAFARAALSPDWTVRLGRMGSPFFMVSDFREVGYANTWLRTPVDVYGQVYLRSFDGADITFARRVADIPVRAQALLGQSAGSYLRTDSKYRHQRGVNVSAEPAEGVTVRAGSITGELTIESSSMRQLVATLAQTPFASVGTQLDCTGRKVSFSGIGLAVDRSDWLVNAEATRLRSNCFVPDTSAAYVMVGRRIGAFTPYAIAGSLRVDDRNVDNVIPATGPFAGLSMAVNGLLQSAANQPQRTRSLGVRWDAYKTAAVKLQVDRIDTQGTKGQFLLPGGKPPGSPVQAVSVAVDFVF